MRPSEITSEIRSLSERWYVHVPVSHIETRDDADAVLAERKATLARIEECKAEKAEIVERIASKVRQVRDALGDALSDDFVRFRFAGSGIPVNVIRGGQMVSVIVPAEEFQRDGWKTGGIYCQDEDERERFVDEYLAEVRGG